MLLRRTPLCGSCYSWFAAAPAKPQDKHPKCPGISSTGRLAASTWQEQVLLLAKGWQKKAQPGGLCLSTPDKGSRQLLVLLQEPVPPAAASVPAPAALQRGEEHPWGRAPEAYICCAARS